MKLLTYINKINTSENGEALTDRVAAEAALLKIEEETKGKKTPWYIKILSIARVFVERAEALPKNGKEKKEILGKTLDKAWEEFAPQPIRMASVLTGGLVKTLITNVIIDGIVFIYNRLFGHIWPTKSVELKDKVPTESPEEDVVDAVVNEKSKEGGRESYNI